jgi:hypothetical protein
MVIIYDFRNARRHEKRRKNRAEALRVEGDEIVARLRLVESLVRSEPFFPVDDLKTLSGPRMTSVSTIRATAPRTDEAPGRGVYKQAPFARPGQDPDEPVDAPAEYDQRCEAKLYRSFLHLVRDDFSWLGSAVAALARFPQALPLLRNADRIVHEARDWLAEKAGPATASASTDTFGYPITVKTCGAPIADVDPIFDADRRLVCNWIQWRDGADRFCADRCIRLADLDRALERLARAIAGRLTEPIIAEDCGSRGGQVVIGAEKIATATRRTPAGVLRLIQGGKLPVASVAGEHVSTQDLLRPHRRHGVSAIAA